MMQQKKTPALKKPLAKKQSDMTLEHGVIGLYSDLDFHTYSRRRYDVLGSTWKDMETVLRMGASSWLPNFDTGVAWNEL
jgi:hypothetical protein